MKVLALVLASALPFHPSKAASPKTHKVFPSGWLRDALCVHSHEGSWQDTGAPYYGGMQFDLSTWAANGGRRYSVYPHQASPTNQLRVAYTTWRRRGWAPWPNTARMCGLL